MALPSKQNTQTGFSILEVLVTIAIIGIITVLVVVRYGAFNSAVLLKNQAFEIALDIREAQVAAVSVRGVGIEFRDDYGLMFAASSSVYRFFVDDDADLEVIYDTSPVDEQVGDARSLDANYVILDICINALSTCGVDELHISFSRPDFDAALVAIEGASTATPNDAHIRVAHRNDLSIWRTVQITAAGQITVE